MSTRPKAPVLTKKVLATATLFLVCSPLVAAEYFTLPANRQLQVPQANLSFSGKKLKLKPTGRRKSTPSVDAGEYFFEKQTFLAVRRDEAIKLVRQELETGRVSDEANALMRLGQLYTEKYMELNYYEIELHNKKLKQWEAKGKKGKAPKLSTSRSGRYLKLALTNLEKLKAKYPRHRRMDEVLYFLGFVNMELGRNKVGVKYLDTVARKYPRSKKYSQAVLHLADHYFTVGQFKNAHARYRTLLKKNDPEIVPYAMYKIAWCQLNLGEPLRGAKNMKVLIKRLEGQKTKSAFNLREQAIDDMSAFYAEAGRPKEGFAFYKSILGEKKAYEKLELIAERMYNKAEDKGAISAYGKLLSARGDTLDAPEYALARYESLMRLGKTSEAVQWLTKVLDRYGSTSDWAKKLVKENDRAVRLQLGKVRKDATNAAMFFHSTAQKTKNKFNYKYALTLYDSLVKNFPTHPQRRKFAFYQGEIFFATKKYSKAIEKYLWVAKQKPKDRLAEESAYNALLSADQMTSVSKKIERFSEKEKKEGKFAKKKIPSEEQQFIRVATDYLKAFPKFKRSTDVRFRIAGIYYRHHHFDEAAKIFEDIAVNHSKHKRAPVAAHLLLDIYNIKKDYASLNKYASQFAANKNLGGKDFRKEMSGLRAQVGFKAIEKLEKEKNWNQASQQYLDYYNKNSKGKLAEDALYNAVVTAEKGTDLKQKMRTSSLFLKKYPSHKYSQRLLLVRAKQAEENYDFPTAQKLYQAYAQKFPKDKEAGKSLYNAAVFAEVLGQTNTALRLYDKYVSQFRPSKKERKDIQLSQAKLYRRARNWRKTAEIYQRLARSAPSVAEKAEFLGKQAELYKAYNRKSDYARVLNELRVLGRKDSVAKSFGPALPYVAEARLGKIQSERKSYERLRLRFPPARLVSDLKRKQAALNKLDTSYGAVTRLGDPEWGVATLSERAKAYDHFVGVYRGLRIPKRYKGAERVELQKQMKQLDTEFIAPFEAKSKELRKLCAEKSQQFFVVSGHANSCIKSLGKDSGIVNPTGLIPRPAYWTTRWGNLGVARR